MAKRRSEPEAGDPRPQWLSTTGGDGTRPRADGRGQCAVALRRTDAPGVQDLPEVLQLGGAWPDVATIGRHERNAAVVRRRAASTVHCQLALRTFHVPQRDEVHEALFLCDASRHGTYVNGTLAFRPWHWVQDGDTVGLPCGDLGPGGVLDVYRVSYRRLRRLPSALVAIPAGRHTGARAPPHGSGSGGGGSGGGGGGGSGGGSAAAVRRPPAAATAAARARSATSAPGRGTAARGGRRAGARPRPRAGVPAAARRFGEEVLGRIIDLSYPDPPETYRMLVVHFDREQSWHHVDSSGLSTWDGESFTDEIDLNQMYGQGLVRFVDGPPAAEGGGRRAGTSRKRGRKH